MERHKIFLYGAAVQGIQSFIFQTNELKDIVGASELVEWICTKCFEKFKGNGELIVSAAGNIKCIFFDEDECRRAVKEFPKEVMSSAPGITISEAVVNMSENLDFDQAVEELERRLRSQRNKPFPSVTLGYMGMERSRKTGLPAVKEENDDFIDSGTVKKRKNNAWTKLKEGTSTTHNLYKKSFGIEDISQSNLPLYVDKMTSDNNWLAIIHADGNGLGKIISGIGKDKELLKTFSAGLDNATTNAARLSFSEIIDEEGIDISNDIIPFRPIVLGGDDLTLICRADLALKFTEKFIRHFEIETNSFIKQMCDQKPFIPIDHLTACAGIAYIKSSYPFFFGYQLAESLCERAKIDAKSEGESPAPSCLMFHKVQSSFIESFDEIVRKELTPCEGHTFEFGPYYIKEKSGYWTVDKLITESQKLDSESGNAVKSDIRQWMTLLSEDVEKAKQKAIRVSDISSPSDKRLFESATNGVKRGDSLVYPAYDMLSIHTINTMITK